MFFLYYILTGIILFITSFWFYYWIYGEWRLQNELIKRNVKYQRYESFAISLYRNRRFEYVADEYIRKTGKVFGYNFLGSLTIMIAEPELIQSVLSKEFTNFINRRKLTTANSEIFTLALSALENERWKRVRAIVAQTFATGKLRRMKPRMDSICKNFIENIDKSMKKDPTRIVNIKDLAGCFTMDTIVQVAFGLKVDSLNDPNNQIITMAKKMFGQEFSLKMILDFIIVFMLPKFIVKLTNKRVFPEIIDFFENLSTKIIEEKRIEYANNKDFSKASTFIELMLEAEHEFEIHEKKQQGNSNNEENTENNTPFVKYMTNDEIVAQCILFFTAGFDTTAATITMACFYLALSPDKQQLAYEEICRLTCEYESLESIPYETVLTKFEYVNCVINETLRLSPPGTQTERRANNDITLSTNDGRYRINIKKDDIIQIPIWSLHHSEEYFPDPEKFRPERFLSNGEGDNFPKYAYLPFGSGPRSCVAKSLALMEAKMALIWLLKYYEFSPCSKTKIPPETISGAISSPKELFLEVENR